MKLFCNLLIFLSCAFCPFSASSDDIVVLEVQIVDHKFKPDVIYAPSNVKIKLVIHNLDNTIEEFESTDFNREKIVPPGKKVNIILAPLQPGRYKFFGEFHQDTAKGQLIIE